MRRKKNQPLSRKKDSSGNISSEYRRFKTQQYKEEIHRLLGDKCVKCGYIGLALQIDHVNGGGNKERGYYRGENKNPSRTHSSQSYYYRILMKIKAGSKDYQLLCANCNAEKELKRKQGA